MLDIHILLFFCTYVQNIVHAKGFESGWFQTSKWNNTETTLKLDAKASSIQYKPVDKMWCEHLQVNESNCKCPDIDLYHNSSSQLCPLYAYSINTCVKKDISRARVVLITVVSVLGIFGNLHVIMVRTTHWNPSPHYQLIVGLSIADLLFSAVCLVEILGELFSPCSWIYSVFMCKTLQSLLALSAHIDLGFITVISIERYAGIVHPFTERFSKMRTRQMILVNIFIGVVLVIPYFIHHDVTSDGICQLQWNSTTMYAYTWAMLIVFFIVPVLLTSILSYKSVKALRKTMYEHGMLSAMDERSRSRLVAENKKIMRVLVVLLLAFVLLVLPNHLVWIFMVTVDHVPVSAFGAIRFLGTVPYSLHVTINPIIYSVLDKRFRAYSLNILRCRKDNEDADCDYDLTRTRVLTQEEGSTSV